VNYSLKFTCYELNLFNHFPNYNPSILFHYTHWKIYFLKLEYRRNTPKIIGKFVLKYSSKLHSFIECLTICQGKPSDNKWHSFLVCWGICLRNREIVLLISKIRCLYFHFHGMILLIFVLIKMSFQSSSWECISLFFSYNI
jgi:hypothetical protein